MSAEAPQAAAPGVVIWITGLSGVGKSTLGRAVHAALRKRFPNTVYLDGDLFRAMVGDMLGYSPAERLKNAYRIARFCKYLSDQGIHVVCATISLFHECQEWNRQNIQHYCEVYIRAPIEVLRRRDTNGLYTKPDVAGTTEVVGLDQSFEEPRSPNLIIENTFTEADIAGFAARVIRQAGLAPTIAS